MFSLYRKKVFCVNRPMTLEQLEERIVLDAAVPASVCDNPENVDNQHDQQAQPSDTNQESNTSPSSGDGNSENTDSGQGEYSSADENPILITNVPGLLSSGWEDSDGNWDYTKVLAISSQVEGAESLLDGASDDTAAFIYNAEAATLDDLVLTVEKVLGPDKADSIGFATHDLGEAKFHLTDGNTISPGSLLGDMDIREFWSSIGDSLADNGRIDLFACDLASTVSGELLISQMEGLTGHTVAASDDPTGAFSAGGDWTLETGGVNLLSVYFSSKEPEGFDVLLAGEEKLWASDGDVDDFFGYSVAIDGNWAIVGSPWDDNTKGEDAGAAYIYYWDGSSWGNEKILTASDGNKDDLFGYSVDIIDGDTDYAIVGALNGDGKEVNSGSAYIFHLNGNSWTQKGVPIVASDGHEWDLFGEAVAIDGNYAIVGASGCDIDVDSNGVAETDVGAAYVFDITTGVELKKLTADDGQQYDYFGEAVSIFDGSGLDYALVGARGCEIGGQDDVGAAYVFYNDNGWTGASNIHKIYASDRQSVPIGVGTAGHPAAPPSEPCMRISRTRLSSRRFTRNGTD